MSTFWDWLSGSTPVTTAAAVGGPNGITTPAQLVEADPVAAAAFGIFAGDAGPVTRTEALSVPGVRRGHNLIAGTIGTLPLVDRRAGVSLPNGLLSTLDPRTTPAWTLTQTVSDLLLRPVSWWRVTSRYADRFPATVEWLRHDRVQVIAPVGAPGYVLVDGVKADDADMIRFDGPDEGLLIHAADTIRLARALARAGKRVADDDWSGLILRLAEGAPELSRDDIVSLLHEWESSRRAHTTAFLNRSIDPEKISVSAMDRQLIEQQRECNADLARHLNLPASRIGAPQGSGMTYTSTEGDRRDLVDTTMAPFLTAIAQRLTLPDVTPAGHRVMFDLTAYLRGTTSELVTAGVAAIAAGITDAPEVRTEWLGLPPRPDLATPTPTPGAPA